ncbi:hypothetical protein A8U91_02655 [Halomonas elongata]|uniref:Uncharacterized protein n=1 Tax=Halomonas elongata TaxID=2746 RepID=A0A1B8P7R3_HALEL|nr:hypothetical protein A8U91_02655 [Halomonas elongata]
MGSQLGNAGLLLVNTLVNIYLFLLMLRFLLQASRADYYNPSASRWSRSPNRRCVPSRASWGR